MLLTVCINCLRICFYYLFVETVHMLKALTKLASGKATPAKIGANFADNKSEKRKLKRKADDVCGSLLT